MGRWSDLARRYEDDWNPLTDIQQKPAERVNLLKNKVALPKAPSQQKPAERVQVHSDPDFLLVSAGPLPAENGPINKGSDGFLLVSAGCRDSGLKPDHAGEAAPDTPQGTTSSGRPRTWTGKVVSLDEWRRLSEWDRHGPNGRVWNGLTRKWETNHAN